MGITTVSVEVANPARPSVTEPLELIVDSGAVYSVVPAEVLERLGVAPLVEQTFRLADGSRILRRKGTALLRYGEYVGGADVIFGEPGDAALLGALSLEALGPALDPVRRELRPIPLLLAAAG
jgi:predicted aspartyl protease